MIHEPDNDEGAAPESEEQPETRRRKEKVLHTRISTVLEEELKRTAEALRVPVSNLVRTILEDALNTVDAVGRAAEEELRGAAERLARERGRWRTAAEEGARAAAPAAEEVVPEEVAAEEVAAEEAAPDEVATEEVAAERDEPLADAAQAVPAPPGAASIDPLAGVLGFQALVLARETRCGSCGRTLSRGEEAFLGVRDVPGPRIIVGPECVPGQQGERS